MTNLCILCEDANIVEARNRLVSTLPGNGKLTESQLAFKKANGIDIETEVSHLKAGCSPTGQAPATHWFCYITVDEETHQKMIGNKLYTIIEEDRVPSEFLADHGLKRIKANWK